MIGIYCITNKVNNKKYFGQSTNIEERKKAYFNKGNFHNNHLKNAFNKYGKENFEFQIIKCCKEKYLDRFEKLYIRINDTTNPDKGYNKETGGNLNKHLSKETKKKISETLTGRTLPEEHKKKISESLTGKIHTEATKKKMSENHVGFIGKKHSKESKEKISKGNTGRTRSEETKKKISKATSGENNPSWKNYPRITKYGKDNYGRQKYIIKYNGKIFSQSINKERLYEKWYDKYPNIELIDETVVD